MPFVFFYRLTCRGCTHALAREDEHPHHTTAPALAAYGGGGGLEGSEEDKTEHDDMADPLSRRSRYLRPPWQPCSVMGWACNPCGDLSSCSCPSFVAPIPCLSFVAPIPRLLYHVLLYYLVRLAHFGLAHLIT